MKLTWSSPTGHTYCEWEQCTSDMPCHGRGWTYLGLHGATRPELTQELTQLYSVYHSEDPKELERMTTNLYHYWMELDDGQRLAWDKETGR